MFTNEKLLALRTQAVKLYGRFGAPFRDIMNDRETLEANGSVFSAKIEQEYFQLNVL